MLPNSGSIAGSVSRRRNGKNNCRYGGSKRTLLFEIIICLFLFGIGIFLLVNWNRTSNNEINVDVNYLGPQARQYVGMKVVRNHSKKQASRNMTDPNSNPGVYFGIATQLGASNTTPLFSESGMTRCVLAPNDSIIKKERAIAKVILGDDFKVDGKELGFVTDVDIKATNVKELFLKKKKIVDSTGHIHKTNNLVFSVVPKSNDIFMDWTYLEDKLCYKQESGYIKPVVEQYWHPRFRLNQDSLAETSSMWWSLFMRKTGIYGKKDIDEYMATKVIMPWEKEYRLQNAFNRIVKEEIHCDVTKALFSHWASNPINVPLPENSKKNLIEKYMKSLKCLVEDTLSIQSYQLHDKQYITCGGDDLELDNSRFEKGEESRMLTYSPIEQTNSMSGYYYYHQSFGRPMAFGTLCDLSHVHDKILFNVSGADSVRIMKFEYEFHTPIDNITCYPDPDDITVTGFVYTDTSKLSYIAKKGLDVYVHFPEYDNTQTVRFFVVTLILTMVVTYLIRRLYTELFVDNYLKKRADEYADNSGVKKINPILLWSAGLVLFAMVIFFVIYLLYLR